MAKLRSTACATVLVAGILACLGPDARHGQLPRQPGEFLKLVDLLSGRLPVTCDTMPRERDRPDPRWPDLRCAARPADGLLSYSARRGRLTYVHRAWIVDSRAGAERVAGDLGGGLSRLGAVELDCGPAPADPGPPPLQLAVRRFTLGPGGGGLIVSIFGPSMMSREWQVVLEGVPDVSIGPPWCRHAAAAA